MKETLMEAELSRSYAVPWTPRDVWIGIGLLIAWLAVAIGASLFLRNLALEVNTGLFVSLAELLLLVPVWVLAVWRRGASWTRLGLRGFQGGMLGLGCGLMLLSYLLNLGYSTLLAFLDLTMQPSLVPILAELSSPWLFAVGVVVIAPLVEEIFFRGFVFAGLRPRYGWKKAAIVSSACFALIHLQPTAVVPIFILGYIFAYLYHRSNSIWPAVLMHVSSNALALGAAYLLLGMDVSL
jgi:membrane protease YdiL (CAAX protease family)